MTDSDIATPADQPSAAPISHSAAALPGEAVAEAGVASATEIAWGLEGLVECVSGLLQLLA